MTWMTEIGQEIKKLKTYLIDWVTSTYYNKEVSDNRYFPMATKSNDYKSTSTSNLATSRAVYEIWNRLSNTIDSPSSERFASTSAVYLSVRNQIPRGGLSMVTAARLTDSVYVSSGSKVPFGTWWRDSLERDSNHTVGGWKDGMAYVPAGFFVDVEAFAKAYDGDKYTSFRIFAGDSDGENRTIMSRTFGATTTADDADKNTGDGVSAHANFKVVSGHEYIGLIVEGSGSSMFVGNSNIAGSFLIVKIYRADKVYAT